MLDLKKPVTTRRGEEVKVYECYGGYCHGAVLDEKSSMWTPVTWTMPGGFTVDHSPSKRELVNYDLINNEPYK